jgi:hypothetical protein
MKMEKQTIQYIVLGVLLVGLLIFTYFTLKPSGSPTTPPTNNPNSGAATVAAVAVPVTPPLEWARSAQVDDLPASIIRDPFKDTLAKPIIVASVPPTATETEIGKNLDGAFGKIGEMFGGALGGLAGSMGIVSSEPHRLKWITGDAVVKALEQFKTVNVEVKKDVVTLTGPGADVEKAYAALLASDVEPPVPDFGLRGIIMTETRPMAFGLYNGQYYQVVKGQAIPGSGWSVTSITDSTMTVTDGNRTKAIKAGGSK